MCEEYKYFLVEKLTMTREKIIITEPNAISLSPYDRVLIHYLTFDEVLLKFRVQKCLESNDCKVEIYVQSEELAQTLSRLLGIEVKPRNDKVKVDKGTILFIVNLDKYLRVYLAEVLIAESIAEIF